MAKYELIITDTNSQVSILAKGDQGPQGEIGPQGPAGAGSLVGLDDVDSTSTAGQALIADGDGTFSFSTIGGVAETLDSVTGRNNTTTNSISVGGVTATSLNTHTIPSGTGTLAKTSDIPTNNNQLTNGAGYLTDYTVTQSDVTTHQAALSITESQISDLQSYLTSESDTLDDVTGRGSSTTNGVTVGSLNTHTIPSGTGTLALTSDLPTNNNQLTNGAGYLTDYTVTEADVTAHQAALSITESQISDLGTYLTAETNDLTSAVTWANVPDANITQSSVTQHQAALSVTESQISDLGTYIPASEKGAASGVATLDSSGLVPTSQLPSYVDDVLEYTNYAGFPGTGETGKIYVDLATGDIYRWSGSAYVQINDAVSSADQATKLATPRTIAVDGDVIGSTTFDGSANVTITATVQDDSHNHIISNVDGLQSALDAKVNTADLVNTDDLTDSTSTTNFYFTDTRARGAITLTSSNTNELSYNQSSGEFSYTSPSTVSQSTAVTLEVRNTTGSTIAKGVPVYIAGHSGQKVLVAPADANDSNKMPAIGLASSAINNNDDGTVTSFGLVAAINTSSFSVGDTLYIDTTPGGTSFGGLTNSAPTGESSAIQNIGKVARSDASQGEIIVSGPGRSNATPNLDDGKVFIGNSSNQAVASSLSTEVSSIVGGLSLNASNIGSGTLNSDRLPDLLVSDFAGAAVVTEAEGLSNSDNDTSFPTTAAVIDYVDGSGSVANDATITLEGGTGMVTTAGDFTTNQGTNETITITHADHTTAGTVSEGGSSRTLAYGGTFNVPSVTYNAQGHVTSTGTTQLTLPASDNTDTTYTGGTGLTLNGTTFDHTNSVTSGTVSEGGSARTLSYGGAFNVPSVTYDSEGHITGTTTTALTLPASDNTDTIPNDSAITIQGGSANGISVTNGGFTLDQSSGQTITIAADLTDLRTKIGDDTTSSIGQITIRPTGVTNDPAGQLRLQCEDANADTHLFTLEGPAHSGFGGAYTWKVPGSQGTAGQGIKLNSVASGVATLGYFDVPSDTDDITEGTNLYYTDARADARVNLQTGSNLDLSGKTTTNLAEGTNLYYTDARADARVNAQTGTNLDLSNKTTTDLAEGTNQYFTTARATSNFNTNLATSDTDDLNEGLSNLYYTDARAQGAITVTDAGGDGSLTKTGGTITYTGPSAAETRAHFSGGTGVTITNGTVAIGQDVGTSANPTFNNLIVNDLTVNGSTTTIDSTTIAVTDSLFKLAKDNSADSIDAGWYGLYNDGTDRYAGIARDASDSGKFILYDNLTDEPTTTVNTAHASFSKATLKANVEGNVTGNVTGTVSSLSNHDTDDLSEGTTNQYYTQSRFDTAFSAKSTDNLSEGSTNQYYTATRFNTAFSGKSTTDLSEGTNLYYTDARADARVNLQTGANLNLGSKSTDDLSEGSTNLYHTTARARSSITVSDAGGDGSLSYNSTTGVLTYTGASNTVKTSDADASTWSFVVDEDNMVSDSATKVPTQQSVKAYVDANAGGITTGKAIAMAIVFGG